MKTGTCVDCGNPCDSRVQRCQSCANRAKAKVQWSDPAVRKKMMDSLQEAHAERRFRFEDITWESNWQIRPSDGRRYIWYWDGDRHRTIYRYQWVWIVANGPIPKGHEVHHISEDKTDDRILNLSCIPGTRHRRIHDTPEQRKRMLSGRGLDPLAGETAICEQCGKVFEVKSRLKANRFCSQPCRIASMQTTRICPTCGETFIGGLEHGKPRKYCSRLCFQTAKR